MARIMTATEFKANVLAVLEEVSQGDEVEITKHGRKVARLIPARGPAAVIGSLVGMAKTAPGVTDAELFTTGERWENG